MQAKDREYSKEKKHLCLKEYAGEFHCVIGHHLELLLKPE
jgi:hypothetical protein